MKAIIDLYKATLNCSRYSVSKDARGSNDQNARQSISDAERCSYIAEMCVELRDLAPRSRLRDLNYLLDLARAEAEAMAKQLEDSGPALI